MQSTFQRFSVLHLFVCVFVYRKLTIRDACSEITCTRIGHFTEGRLHVLHESNYVSFNLCVISAKEAETMY